MQKFTKWLIYSSENPEQFSLTIKGAVATLLPVVFLLVNQLGFSLDGANVEQYVASAIAILTTLITLYGLLRKLRNTFRSKKVAVSTKEKKLSTFPAKKPLVKKSKSKVQ